MAQVEGASPQEQEDKILLEAKINTKKNAYQLVRAMDEDNMRETLRFSAAMLSELRTSLLSPQKYYELYMLIFDQLAEIEAFFGDERSKGRTFGELYEMVQHAGNVLPRLYLMVAVGCLYIKSGEAPARDILKDLVELCKGVQHPTRGLFLRSYLCQRSRTLLPDSSTPSTLPAANGPQSEGLHVRESGTIYDSLDFLMSNFVEMNKLWVRMQHQGTARDREKREVERQQLADLVGRNLTYISQLEGLGFDMYSQRVLPRVMEQIISCKDDIAQQYLFQAVVQCFPDAFHLDTLGVLLNALPELQPGVKVHTVLAGLMDRLARYAATDNAALGRLTDINAFHRFNEAISHILQAQSSMPAADAVEMYAALMNFTGSVYPHDIGKVNQVLAAAHKALAGRGLSGDLRAERALVALLTTPITKYDISTTLGLSEYPVLMALLRQRTHKDLATRIVQTVLRTETRIEDGDKATALFRFIQPLVHDISPQAKAGGHAGAVLTVDDLDDEDVQNEQVLVARVLHSLQAPSPDVQFQLLQIAHQQLLLGGMRRLRHTLPALGFATLRLVRRIASGESAQVTPEVLLKWLLQQCVMLAEVPEPLTALRLMLAGALCASEEAQGLELLAYSFFEQAFMLYEEAVPDQRARITALHSIVGTLHSCHCFSQENWETLVQNATGYAAKLLRRGDQCRAVCMAARLFWQEEAKPATGSAKGLRPPVRESHKVTACLQRAMKIANAAKQQAVAASSPFRAASLAGTSPPAPQPLGAAVSNSQQYPLGLYVEVLNHHLLYLSAGVEGFTPQSVQHLIDKVQEEVESDVGAARIQLQQQQQQQQQQQANGDAVASENSALAPMAEALRYWLSTAKHIESQRGSADGAVKSRYAQLQLKPLPELPAGLRV